MQTLPPRLATRLLRRAFRNDPAVGSIVGDLYQDFSVAARHRGLGPARRGYWLECTGLIAGKLATDSLRFFFRNPTMNDLFAGGFVQDARYALRSLRRSPGFVVFTALIIGLGVGATTAVFSVMKPLMIAPLPFENPEALVWIEKSNENGSTSLSGITSRTGNLRDYREMVQSFEAMTGYNAFSDQSAYTLTGDGRPEQIMGFDVAHDFLDVLGIRPALGRSFNQEESLDGGPASIVLSHGFWQRRFGGEPGIVGRTLILDNFPREVIGVLPESFDFASVFAPASRVDFLQVFPISDRTDNWGNTLFMVGRLRPGTTVETAQQELDAASASLEAAQPDRWGLGAAASPIRDHIAGPLRSAMYLLAAAAFSVLLIVCVNVSNMLLARSPGRSREVAVRRAFGASRGRMVRQFMLESLVISGLGAVVGAGAAVVATRLVAGSTNVSIPLLDSMRVDLTALAFGVAISLVTGLGIGILPALRVAEGDEGAILRAGGRSQSSTRSARRLRESLVVAEVSLACVLLVVGGLLLRSFQQVLNVDLGFDTENAVAWQLNPSGEFESVVEEATFYQALTDRIAQIPGVTGVGLADALPMGKNRTWGFRVEGVETEEGIGFFPYMVDGGYFDAMGIEIVDGRGITDDDVGGDNPVMVISESAARLLFPNSRAVGRRLVTNGSMEIVGVAADIRHLSPESEPGILGYFSIGQNWDYSSLEMVVRSARPTDQITSAVTAALVEIDSDMPAQDFWTLESRVDQVSSPRRFTLGILSAFGGAALLLAGLGIYGVLAYSVAEQRSEIGIRMALGASSGEILRKVIGRTMLLAGIGILVGGAISIWATRLLSSLLFGVSATDPATFVGMAVALLAVAAAAGAVPATRAARIRGIRALQAE